MTRIGKQQSKAEPLSFHSSSKHALDLGTKISSKSSLHCHRTSCKIVTRCGTCFCNANENHIDQIALSYDIILSFHSSFSNFQIPRRLFFGQETRSSKSFNASSCAGLGPTPHGAHGAHGAAAGSCVTGGPTTGPHSFAYIYMHTSL